MIKLNSFQGHKDSSMYTNQSMWFINKRKDQNHIVILTDEEKASDKSQYLFMIKTLTKMGIEGTYVNITKTIYDKITANIILKGEKLKAFLAKFRNNTRMPTRTTSIQHSIGSPSHSNQTRKGRRHPNWKERGNVILFADDLILFRENPKVSTQMLLELIDDVSKALGDKINIQKSVVFIYISIDL